MASSRKPPSAERDADPLAPAAAVARFLEEHELRGKRLVVGLSGGVDSVVLLHVLKSRRLRLSAIHVHHGLSPNAERWARFCRALCRGWSVPLAVRRVRVAKAGKGPEAAAREARYEAFRKLKADCLLLAHQLDDQAETVLMNLLRGAGVAGARGMAPLGRLDGKALARPLLGVPREAIVAYARRHRLEWVEDESNADQSLTRNFVRRRLGPLIAARFPRWRESLARAARHFSSREIRANELLRAFLASQGLRAPSEAKLVEMLKQLTSGAARTRIEHDGARLRVYRGRLSMTPARREEDFVSLEWKGERRLPIPALGGELVFRLARGKGIDATHQRLQVRLRSGGERLRPDARRPRRTLKNLFQEAGVPPWERERLPLLFSGEQLVWVPGVGVEARYQARADAPGMVPEWRRIG
ncbi:MAG: tRNA lysidine(34) synthetase TilS [Betaproteobacteria bacterium]|nr:tRNA lysidine(34) synthetase TilS [Betaproteobacteria bacterium]